MPLYDYKCRECGEVFEARTRIDDEVIPCSTCQAPADRQIGAPSFVLKGTGWYETDFKNKK